MSAEPVYRNPEYIQLLEKMKDVHEKKSRDYAKDSNVFSNFEFAARLSEPFSDPVDRVFSTLIGVKIARLQELLFVSPGGEQKIPNNESIEDSFLDATNYFAIWTSYHMKKAKEKAASEQNLKTAFEDIEKIKRGFEKVLHGGYPDVNSAEETRFGHL